MEADITGFGRADWGASGPRYSNYGVRRQGENVFDVLAGTLNPSYSNNILIYDFDNGIAANNALASFGSDVGLGNIEVGLAPGDSGGPAFLLGRIAGVNSFGASFGTCPPDINTPANLMGGAGCKLDFSFGEMGGLTRVSSFQTFIDDAIGASVPEPSTVILVGCGLLGVLAWRHRG